MDACLTLDTGQRTQVDALDLPALATYRWIYLGGYAVRQLRRASGGTALVYLHRQLLAARPGEVVDHINNDRLDNRRVNLRLCSPAENAANRRSPRTEGYRGVYFEMRGQSWRAQIKVGRKNRYLGTYRTAEAAALAYDAAARVAFGRFARLNFPDRGVEQLALGLDDAPFDLPAPARSRIDGYEIVYLRRWAAARAPLASALDALDEWL